MTENLSALLYLVAAICFIMALKGLSSPETSRAGNLFGIAGMTIAIDTTLASPHVDSYWLIILGLIIGGSIGAYIARKIEMTALPQLVAAFHSLVGLAAVCVAAAAFYAPETYGIGVAGDIHSGSLLEMGLGTAIGAITFTGSIVAFAKLQALISGKPLMFPMQHWLNLGLGDGHAVAGHDDHLGGVLHDEGGVLGGALLHRPGLDVAGGRRGLAAETPQDHRDEAAVHPLAHDVAEDGAA